MTRAEDIYRPKTRDFDPEKTYSYVGHGEDGIFGIGMYTDPQENKRLKGGICYDHSQDRELAVLFADRGGQEDYRWHTVVNHITRDELLEIIDCLLLAVQHIDEIDGA